MSTPKPFASGRQGGRPGAGPPPPPSPARAATKHRGRSFSKLGPPDFALVASIAAMIAEGREAPTLSELLEWLASNLKPTPIKRRLMRLWRLSLVEWTFEPKGRLAVTPAGMEWLGKWAKGEAA